MYKPIDKDSNQVIHGATCTVKDNSGNIYTVLSNPGKVVVSKGKGVLRTKCVKKGYEQIKIIYNTFLVSSLFILLFFSGILFLCTDIFLVLIYGPSYLEYSSIVKVMLLTVIFLGIGSPFESYMRSTDNTKWILWYRLISFI